MGLACGSVKTHVLDYSDEGCAVLVLRLPEIRFVACLRFSVPFVHLTDVVV